MSNVFDVILDEEKEIFETTYDSKMKVTRKNEKSKVEGRTKYTKKVIYNNKDCSVVRKSDSQNGQTYAENTIFYTEILFCSPELKIIQGDKIEVTDKKGDVTEYKAGVPSWFSSHQEVILEREDRA